MKKSNNHYYLMGGERFENMKEIQDFMGSDSRAVFRSLRQKGFIERIEISDLDGSQNKIVDEKEAE